MVGKAKTWTLNGYVYGVLGVSWLVLALISVNSIFGILIIPFLSVTFLGWMAWGVIIVTLILLSRCFLRQTLLVFLLFFGFGIWFGPFLEPPADTFEHLRRTQTFCEKSADDLAERNNGFWHYSMSSVFLCSESNGKNATAVLFKIDVLHGIYQGLVLAALFVLGKSAGLPDRWAFLSCCISFLFFGTNRFSYFSYYSFAPTYSSMLIYWLWITVFFFRKDCFALVSGVICALLLIPILWINHVQEIFLLWLVVFVWLFLNIHEYIWSCFDAIDQTQGSGIESKRIFFFRLRCYKRFTNMIFRSAYLAGVIFVLFILPQWGFFQDSVSKLFLENYWRRNQSLLFTWNDYHFFGKILAFRVNESFTWIGFILIVLGIPFFYSDWIRKSRALKTRVFLLAILPFIGYCVPLVHFAWVSNVKIPEYYRLCYSSMFWLFFAYFFWGLEGRFVLAINAIRRRLVR